jgi:hypothetical protein
MRHALGGRRLAKAAKVTRVMRTLHNLMSPPNLFRRVVPLLAVLCVGLSNPVHGQTLSRGAVEGVVRDAEGTGVVDAQVRLTDSGSGLVRMTQTGWGGAFRFDLLAPGEYEVLVEQFGFQPLEIGGIPVRPAAALRLEMELGVTEGAALSVERRRYDGSALDRRAATIGQWMGALHGGLPRAGYDLAELGRRSSQSLGSRAVFGLPSTMYGVAVDGVQLGMGQPVSLRSDGYGAGLVPLGSLGAAELVTAGADVEWNGLGGGVLSGYTRRGGRSLEIETFGSWTGGGLSDVEIPGRSAPAASALHGGAIVRGPVIADTAHFLIGVETRRLREPAAHAWRAAELIDRIVSAAHRGHGVDLDQQLRTDLVETDLTTLFGRFDWLVTQGHELSVATQFTTLPAGHSSAALEYPLGFGNRFSGSDLFAAGTLISTFSDRLTQEAKLAVVSSTREYEGTRFGSGRSGAVLPNLAFVSGGLSFGSDAMMPGRYEQTTVRFTESLYWLRGAHRWKGGFVADLARYSYGYRLSDAAEFIFSDPDGFADGVGYHSQITAPVGQADFSLPRMSFFVQDTWAPAAGLELLLGVRYDYDLFPRDRVRAHPEWARQSGLQNEEIRRGAGRFNPRLGFVWDVQDDGSWVIQGSAGVYSGAIDPHVFGELITHDGRLQRRRGVGVLGGWPNVADSAAAPVVGPALSLLAPGFRAPRTTQGMLGLARQLDGQTHVYVQGVARQTDFLPRRSDLNLFDDELTKDQHGRPIFGELEQHGGLLIAANESNRRFPEFDRVGAINADGNSSYLGLTVGIDRQLARSLSGFGSYTFSRTRDNWLAPLQGAEAQLVPLGEATGGARWAESVSDFDVPHQAVLGAQLRTPGPLGISVAGLYRFRSGYPFTPGFRAGVDMNGDGSSRNDPAFVDESIAGTSELVASWACLREYSGRFVARNACRTESVHALDLRLGVRLFQNSRRSGELYVDALSLIGAEPAFVDNALYLIDERREVAVDPATGRLHVPLVVNPDFGKSLVSNTTGRVLRLGFQLQY